MDKIKIGIPRSIYYYEYGNKWKYFFEYLGFDVIISPPTNKEILDNGVKFSTDEMCLSMKLYLGHINYLKDKCDYIIIPRIDRFTLDNQTCTNFLALYDIVNNIFDIKILNYNIDFKSRETEKKGLYKIAKYLKIKRRKIKKAYKLASIKSIEDKTNKFNKNYELLTSKKIRILIISHPYISHDEYVGVPLIKYLEKLGVDIIYSDYLATPLTNKLSKKLSKTLYWKQSKDQIGVIELVKHKIDGIIFLSAFPCGLDSLVNELVIRKINIPNINIIVDDIDSLTGMQTRLESFIDILEQNNV